MSNTRPLLAEALGSFVLLFCGGLVIFSSGGDLLAVAFGFGLALLAGLYAFGEKSGGHYNPAVSLGALLDGRIDAGTFGGYVVAQTVGAVAAGFALRFASTQAQVAGTATVASIGTVSAILIEIVLTALFVAVILRVTQSEVYGGGALVAIPLTLIMIHLAAIPLTGASVNPTRSFGSALAGNRWESAPIWLIGPFVGAVVGWALYRAVYDE